MHTLNKTIRYMHDSSMRSSRIDISVVSAATEDYKIASSSAYIELKALRGRIHSSVPITYGSILKSAGKQFEELKDDISRIQQSVKFDVLQEHRQAALVTKHVAKALDQIPKARRKLLRRRSRALTRKHDWTENEEETKRISNRVDDFTAASIDLFAKMLELDDSLTPRAQIRGNGMLSKQHFPLLYELMESGDHELHITSTTSMPKDTVAATTTLVPPTLRKTATPVVAPNLEWVVANMSQTNSE